MGSFPLIEQLVLGSRVYAQRDTGVCSRGEPGVVYELYELDGRRGASVLFQSGGYDGFSPQETQIMLASQGSIDPVGAHFRFGGVYHLTQLRKDLDWGAFAPFAHFEASQLEQGLEAARGPERKLSL